MITNIRILFKNYSNWVDRHKKLSIFLLIIGALLVRFAMFTVASRDYRYFLSYWMDFIVTHDGIYSWKYAFHNYQMPYIYLLTLFCYLPVNTLFSVKILSLIFDFIAAFAVFKIVRFKYKDSFSIPFTASFLFLFVPTVALNGSCLSQCDVIYTTFLLFSGYYCLKNKHILSIVFFAVAFAFKAQAIFFAPVLFIFWGKKKFNILWFSIVPVLFFILVLPAFFVGRNLEELILIYKYQFNFFDKINMNAPNIYNLFSNDYYNIIVPAGVIFSFISVCIALFFIIKNKQIITDGRWIEIMLLFLILLPYTLPKMHERYFFPADAFSVIYLFYFKDRILVPFFVIVGSCFAYLVFFDVSIVVYFREFVSYPTIGMVFTTFGLLLVIYFLQRKELKNGFKDKQE